MARNIKNSSYRPSKYKNVHSIEVAGERKWVARFYVKEVENRNSKLFESEREAAIAVDKFNLEHGKQPVNILKKKR